uniref:Secreted protein n=1 Tax=Toxocara canis TaxID=6265 RepID=A0A183U3D0_TOXCA
LSVWRAHYLQVLQKASRRNDRIDRGRNTRKCRIRRRQMQPSVPATTMSRLQSGPRVGQQRPPTPHTERMAFSRVCGGWPLRKAIQHDQHASASYQLCHLPHCTCQTKLSTHSVRGKNALARYHAKTDKTISPCRYFFKIQVSF